MPLPARTQALVVCAALCVLGCASSELPERVSLKQIPQQAAPIAWRRATSLSGGYSVSWRPNPDPIVTGEPFQMEFRVHDAAGDLLAPSARVFPDAAMPAHGHGMTRQPVAERRANGDYVARGMLLHMAGDWLLSFDIQDGEVFDRATFNLTLDAGQAQCAGCEEIQPGVLARILELSPLPAAPDDPTNAVDLDPAAAQLGQFLFFDKRLSGEGNVSCASCHDPKQQWADSKAVPDLGTPLERNSPALWNVSQGRWFFWGGRADSLWSQALKPLEDEREHAGDRLSYARLIHGDSQLKAAYEGLFGALPDLGDQKRFPLAARPVKGQPEHPLQRAWQSMAVADQELVNRVFANLGKSIAAFERRLISNDSDFDRYVRGLREGDDDLKSAMSPSALRGLDLFLGKAACHNCHSGPNFSDKEFHNTRLPKVPGSSRDSGRFNGLQKLLADPFQGKGLYADGEAGRLLAAEKLDFLIVSGDSYAEFKTPTLRNAVLTGPYMHDGQFETIEEVIDFYSDEVSPPNIHAHQERVLKPAHLNATEKVELLDFLKALVDDRLDPSLMLQPPSPRYQQ